MEERADDLRRLLMPDELKEILAKGRLMFPDGEQMEGYIGPEVEDIYKAPQFIITTYEFSREFNSLYRYWVLIKSYIKDYLRTAEEQKNSIKGPFARDRKFVFEESDGMDIEKFPDFLMGSIITYEMSLLENYLYFLCLELEDNLEIPFEIDEKDKRSFLEKYVSWLRDSTEIEMDFDSELYKTVDAFRMIRNTFVHDLSNDFPEKAKRIISKAINGQPNEKIKVDEKLVEASFRTIVEFMSLIDETAVQ